MDWLYRFRWSLLALLLIAVFLVLVNLPPAEDSDEAPDEDAAASTATSEPRLILEDCEYELPRGVRAECGWYAPALNPGGYDPLRLPVLVLQPEDAPGESTTLFLPGGPGAPGGTDESAARHWSQWLLGQDWPGRLVVFDPRGTGRAQPALHCPKLPLGQREILGKELDPVAEARAGNALLAECYRDHRDAGRNPQHFDTGLMQADVLGLLDALDAEEVSLLGVSHGSRVALQLMRGHAYRFRAVVLDGVFPPEKDPLMSLPEVHGGALERLAEQCHREDACRAWLPDIRPVLNELVTRLDAEPVGLVVTPPDRPPVHLHLNGYRFAGLLGAALSRSEDLQQVPQALVDAQQGDFRRFAEIASQSLAATLDPASSRPVYWASICAEARPQPDFAEFDRRLQEADPGAVLSSAAAREFPCVASWPAPDAGAPARQPVHSHLPTLLLAGQMDSLTPSAWAREQAQRLPQGQFLEVPRATHGQLFSLRCAERAAREFIADPHGFDVPGDCAVPDPLFEMAGPFEMADPGASGLRLSD